MLLDLALPQVQVADAAPTDRVRSHVERGAEREGLGRVQDGREAPGGPDVPERGVEEAGSHGPVALDDGGDPRRVAGDRSEVALARDGREMAEDPGPQAPRGFGDEARDELRGAVALESVDLG